ncbi:peptidoglycan-binding protein [Streptomyces sp. NPDC001455]|uniref:peptidoglycan-binding protein n=1 Tax=unclassified Streptomyces TaxID=2593676 RepID=UPI0033211C66
MTDSTVTNDDEHPGRDLAELLRSWWESSTRDGREKPTQQSLAKRLGIDQTTLSRYLNPAHSSNAPCRIVEQLHTALGAPADELVRARALANAAAGSASPRRRPGAGNRSAPATTATGGDAPVAGSEAEPTSDGPGTAPAPGRGSGTGRWDRSRVAWTVAAASALLLLLAAGWTAWWPGPTAGSGDAKAVAEVSDQPSEGTDWPLARKGNVLWKARTVQLLLRAHGYDVKVDADYGPATAEAVKRFQTAHALTADGKVGKDTWPLLITTVDSRAREPEAVMAVQYLLHRAGVATDSTGTYTPSTMRSLKEFQASRNLPVTGVGDEVTWRALLNAQGPDLHKQPRR